MKRAYDIVVVGAGAAGCAAARACALRHPDAAVALIEQGERRTSWPEVMRVPLLQPYIATVRKSAPFLETVPSAHEENLAGRSLAYTVGCGLGGSTVCNDMKYMRGTRADYEAWSDPAWTYDELRSAFCSLESNTRGASGEHGADGPLRVSDAQRSNVDAAMNVRFFEACEAAGVPATDDFNVGATDGFSAMQTYTTAGERLNVCQALLGSDGKDGGGQHLANLDVITERRVERVLCEAGAVRGVELAAAPSSADEVAVRVLEAARVVVCAGTLRSPVLLQRSGIGAEGSVVDNAAVGRNMITTTAVDMVFRIDNPVNVDSKSLSWRNLRYLCRQWREYSEDRGGIFSAFLEGAAYVRSRPERNAPDLSLQFFRSPQMGTAQWPHCWPLDGFTMRVTHHYPSSRGEVCHDTKTGATLVRSGLLSTKPDVLAMDEGVQWVGLLTSRDGTLRSVHHVDEKEQHVSPFWSYKAALHHPRRGLVTQCDTAAFLAENVMSGGDVFGTCAMGSVVDGQLRVKGVTGLFVADSSVVPVPTVADSRTVGSVIGTRVASFVE